MILPTPRRTRAHVDRHHTQYPECLEATDTRQKYAEYFLGMVRTLKTSWFRIYSFSSIKKSLMRSSLRRRSRHFAVGNTAAGKEK